MMYKYKQLKTNRGILNHLKEFNLVAMSIAKEVDIEDNPVYLVANPKYKKDLSTIQFATFTEQEPLNDYLYENPSGLFFTTKLPLEWLVKFGNPTYYYREFTAGVGTYTILEIHDQGLIFSLLLGNTYSIPYLTNFPKEAKIDVKTDGYNLTDLFNHGLLGRITNTNIKTNQYEVKYSLSNNDLVGIWHKTDKVNSEFALVNGTITPTIVKGMQYWKQLEVQTTDIFISDWLKGVAFPKAIYTLRDHYSTIKIEVKSLLADEQNQYII